MSTERSRLVDRGRHEDVFFDLLDLFHGEEAERGLVAGVKLSEVARMRCSISSASTSGLLLQELLGVLAALAQALLAKVEPGAALAR